jgi:protein subunit release factor A
MSFKDFMNDLNKNRKEIDEEIGDMDIEELHRDVVELAQELADISAHLQNSKLKDIVHNQANRTDELLFHYTVLLDAKEVLEAEIKKLEEDIAKIDSKLKVVEYYLKTY